DLVMADVTAGAQAAPRGETIGSIAARYGAALAMVAIAFSAREFLNLANEAAYLFFIPAVLIASGFGGFGPGFLATICSIALANYFQSGSGPLDRDVIISGAFGVIGLG